MLQINCMDILYRYKSMLQIAGAHYTDIKASCKLEETIAHEKKCPAIYGKPLHMRKSVLQVGGTY